MEEEELDFVIDSDDASVETQQQQQQQQQQRRLFSRLDDIAGFRSTRATKIQDNYAFWKRTLTAYGNEAKREFNIIENHEQNTRMKRIRSAPTLGMSKERFGKKEEKLLPKRCQSVQDWRGGEMKGVSENRAVRLRLDYISHLHSMNGYSALTRMNDYQVGMRSNRPSHSARYPRFIQKQKTDNDPEWGVDEYDVYIFNSKSDNRWVSVWLKGPLEAKRFNVKTRATAEDIERSKMHRMIIVLTPNFIRKDLQTLENINFYSHVLVIKLKQCQFPEALCFTSYIDLSFKDMTDTTLQNRLLPKLIATLQLPKPICS